jgi:hypothetical protein
LAVSEVIGSPSGSVTVAVTTSGAFSAPLVVAGAVSTGGRSRLATAIDVVTGAPGSALAAVKLTP